MWRDTSLAPASSLGGTVKKVSSCTAMSRGILATCHLHFHLDGVGPEFGLPQRAIRPQLGHVVLQMGDPALRQMTDMAIGALMSSMPPTKKNARPSSSANSKSRGSDSGTCSWSTLPYWILCTGMGRAVLMWW